MNDPEFSRTPWFRYDAEWGSLERAKEDLHLILGDWADITSLLKLSLYNGIKFGAMIGNRRVIRGGKGLKDGLDACVETETEAVRNA